MTGTAGPREDRQFALSQGKVDGDKVKFQVDADGAVIKFALVFANGHLKGDASPQGLTARNCPQRSTPNEEVRGHGEELEGKEKSLLSAPRRAGTLLAVLAFVAGPALRLDCLLSCGVPESVSVSSCHAASPIGPVDRTGGRAHCASHLLPAAVAANRGCDRTPRHPYAVAVGAAIQPSIIAPIDRVGRAPLAVPASASTRRLPLRI